MEEIIKSVYFDQEEILNGIIKLHCPDGFDCDVTYGNGRFYKNIKQPNLKFDIDPQLDGVQKACSKSLPIESESLNSLVFDPPFLTYISKGRKGNGKMVMANRFSGYWKYSELEDHYTGTIKEASRVLKNNGIMVFKCQDIIHNHKMHCTHLNVINWADKEKFRLVDLFILAAKHRMIASSIRKQQHSRIYHSYFLVFRKEIRKNKNG